MAWRLLRHNKRCSVPHNLAFFDCETWPLPPWHKRWYRSHTLRMGCATGLRLEGGEITRRDEIEFTKPDEFWQWVKGRIQDRQPLWLFAHNASFDLPIAGILNRIDEGDYLFPAQTPRNNSQGEPLPREWFDNCFLAIDALPIILKGVVPGRGKLICLDSLNYFPMRLADVGELTGTPKLKMPGWDALPLDWLEYCKNDVKVLEESIVRLIRWWDEIDGGNFKMTAGGLAMSLFRHKHYKTEILFHDEPEAKELERAGYFGGQLECFRLGHFVEPMFAVDVNSLYPYVMLTNLFPRRLAAYHTPQNCPHKRPLGDLHECMADVLIDSDLRSYPVRWGLGHQYAVGEFRTTLTGPELVAAERWGDIKEYFGWTRYRLADLFSDYMEYVLGLRRKMKAAGDGVGEQFAKLLANSLYGKFAQREPAWVPCPDVDALDEWSAWCHWRATDGTFREFRSIGYNVYENRGKVEKESNLPAIAAFVTAYGRCYMEGLRSIAGWHNVYYQATDSLHVNETGYLNLRAAGMLHPTEPGKLKLEATDSEAHYYGLHRYSCGRRVKRGSIKRDAVIREDGKWVFETFEKLPAIVRRPPDGVVRTFQRVVEFDDGRYAHRAGQDGWVEPLVLGRGGSAADAIEPASVVSAAERARAAWVRS